MSLAALRVAPVSDDLALLEAWQAGDHAAGEVLFDRLGLTTESEEGEATEEDETIDAAKGLLRGLLGGGDDDDGDGDDGNNGGGN